MWNAATWREKAAEFRQRAQTTRDAERERIFQHLAEDCDDMAARLEQTPVGNEPIDSTG